MAAWEQVAAGLDHGGYVAWETAVAAAQGSGGRDMVPVFAALQSPVGRALTLAEAIDATLALPGVHFSQHERDLMTTERALAGEGWPHDVRVVAFCPRTMLTRMPDFWRVLRVGPGIVMPIDAGLTPGENLCEVEGVLRSDVPLAAVIDDGIGFLNARFRQDRGHSRIKAVWLQAQERVVHGTAGLRDDVLCGQVLEEAGINSHLAAGGEEAEVYRMVNRALAPVTESALTNRRVAHGTHVLDLAAGAAPWADDKMRSVPILAVQLPPVSVRETMGRRMETYLVQGLRWIMAQALRLAKGTDVPPVVVNISLGSLAGPGDQTAFLADWFKHEVARHARLTGGAKLRLVIAYGNARLARLVARDEMRRSHPLELIWRILPDDHTPSHLELRVDTNLVAGLQLDVQPPTGSGIPAFVIDWPTAGTGWWLPGPLAMVTATAESGGQSLLQLTLAPTAGAGPVAPAGAWRVVLRTTVAEPVRVTARVQRDDTPPGYRALGRQSWLDHPLGWDWDAEARGYVAPRDLADAPGCPVTREGTCVAYAGAEDPSILFVGSVRPIKRDAETGQPVTDDQSAVWPSVYSSEGVRHMARPGESFGPTLVAFGDDGTLLPGKRAAGVLSGSVTRMSGTSMAAPQVARALIEYFLNVLPADQTLEGERIALIKTSDWGKPDRRLGHGMLAG